MVRLVLIALLSAPILAGCGGAGRPPADRPDPTAPGPEPEGGGFASPPDPEPSGKTQHSTEVTPELAAQIRRTFGERCRFERACGPELIGVDCDAAVDGPYYYVRRGSLEVVSRCGGFCMSGTCTDCPPKGWTCATY